VKNRAHQLPRTGLAISRSARRESDPETVKRHLNPPVNDQLNQGIRLHGYVRLR
jgi:hypothetical protein